MCAKISSQFYRSSVIGMGIKCRRLKWADYVARIDEDRRAFKMLTGKSTGKITLGTVRRRLEENIRVDLKEMVVNPRNWID